LTTPEIQTERTIVQNKLIQLHELIKDHVHRLKLHENPNHIVSSLNPADHPDGKLRSMWIAYGTSEAGLKKYNPPASLTDVMHLQIILQQKVAGIWLVQGKPNAGKADREYFKNKMNDAEYRKQFFNLLISLGAGYWIEISGDKKAIDTFQNEDALWEFTKADDWVYYAFIIGKNYLPADHEISSEQIATTIMREFDKLVLVYRHIKTVIVEKSE